MSDIALRDPKQPGNQSKVYLGGFTSLSAILSSDPDLQVFRRFNTLAVRNLLYLQAEILSLEARLSEHDEADLLDGLTGAEAMETKYSARCWEAFREKADAGEEREQARMMLIRQIRERMAEYQDALLRQSGVLKLENPNTRVRTAVTEWFEQIMPLVGHGRKLFANKKDLVALRTPEDQDRLSLFMQDRLGPLLAKTHKDHPTHWHGIQYFSEKTIRHLVSILSVLLSALLMIGAIVSLYFVERAGVKLGLVAAFTALFAGSVGLLTNARKSEIYAATAA